MVISLNGQIKSDPFLSSEHNRNGHACQSTARTETRGWNNNPQPDR